MSYICIMKYKKRYKKYEELIILNENKEIIGNFNSFKEIAETFNLTRQRIYQIYKGHKYSITLKGKLTTKKNIEDSRIREEKRKINKLIKNQTNG